MYELSSILSTSCAILLYLVQTSKLGQKVKLTQDSQEIPL